MKLRCPDRVIHSPGGDASRSLNANREKTGGQQKRWFEVCISAHQKLRSRVTIISRRSHRYNQRNFATFSKNLYTPRGAAFKKAGGGARKAIGRANYSARADGSPCSGFGGWEYGGVCLGWILKGHRTNQKIPTSAQWIKQGSTCKTLYRSL